MGPALTPGAANSKPAISVRQWFRQALHDETLFTAMIFSTLSHQRTRALMFDRSNVFYPEDQRWLDQAHFSSIRMLRQSLQDPKTATTDANVLSVLILAELASSDKQLREMAIRAEAPFNAPFRSLQWVDVYSSLRPNVIHLAGLIKIIELKGGLKSIKLPCLAAVVSLFDIVHSTKVLHHPHFGFIALQDLQDPTIYGIHNFTAADVLAAFSTHLTLGFTEPLATVMHAMRLYTSMLRGYLHGSIRDPDLQQVADQRNIIQFTLSSLPTASESKFASQDEKGVYEIVRIAALIFSVSVIIPQSALEPTYAAFVKLLRSELQLLEEPGAETGTLASAGVAADTPTKPVLNAKRVWTDLVMWATFMGGIVAAIGSDDRAWYVDELRSLVDADARNIASWEELQEVLEQTLWLGEVCRDAADALWTEIVLAGANRTSGGGLMNVTLSGRISKPHPRVTEV